MMHKRSDNNIRINNINMNNIYLFERAKFLE